MIVYLNGVTGYIKTYIAFALATNISHSIIDSRLRTLLFWTNDSFKMKAKKEAKKTTKEHECA